VFSSIFVEKTWASHVSTCTGEPLQAQWRILMVNNCANPKCAKPLHYLREGRVFVFDVQEDRSGKITGGKQGHHLEHYWLCGACSQLFMVEYESEKGVRLVPRLSVGKYVVQEKMKERPAPTALAS
jgi:hypothetical protein